MKNWKRRDFLKTGAVLGLTSLFPAPAFLGATPSSKIRAAVIGCGTRGRYLARAIKEVGEELVLVCDPDTAQIERMQKKHPEVAGCQDLREVLDRKDIDTVFIATCNHWHCLAAIWAMEAGKDVYVEKPLSHNVWEGRQAVHAARRYQRVCQVGTHQRSDLIQEPIRDFLHREKGIGEILSARVNRLALRKPIGRLEEPLKIPETIDYNLWLGPAQDLPLFRPKFHYDWHWAWNTGCGEMGNWGVHVFDDCRNVIFQDQAKFPRRILAGGVRLSDDAGETPDLEFAWFDSGTIPVVIALSNLDVPPAPRDPYLPGPTSGYIAYGEGGRMEGVRGRAVAFDSDNKVIRVFELDQSTPEKKAIYDECVLGARHVRNFFDAVRNRDSALLNADVEVGHCSTTWCNLANVACRCGHDFHREEALRAANGLESWTDTLESFRLLLEKQNRSMETAGIRMSSVLTFDEATESFVGDGADAANPYLKREYRDTFIVPDLA